MSSFFLKYDVWARIANEITDKRNRIHPPIAGTLGDFLNILAISGEILLILSHPLSELYSLHF